MPVPTDITDLSTTESSNSPLGTENIGTNLDDYLRAIQAIIKQGVSKGSDIASSSTISIPNNGHYFSVTGTTSITTINDAWNGREVVLVFAGALTLTHSAGLILPGSANITTAAGDIVKLVNESAGVWRCTHYLDSSGSVLTDADIGVTVQAYDADTTKNDVANTFTAKQTFLGSHAIDSDGLKFNGDTAAANALDDYEEGTWTPTFEPASGAFGSITYASSRIGRYVKIGKVVICHFLMRTDAITVGTASGNAYIGGLPFTVNSNIWCIGSIAYSNAFGGDNPDGILANKSNTTCNLYFRTSSNGGSSVLQVADLGTGATANTIYGMVAFEV